MNTAVLEKEKTEKKLNQLEQLKQFMKIVADTGDFESIKEFKPRDATTNPSLIYAATQKEQYFHLLEKYWPTARSRGLSGAAQIEDIIDHLLVKFGCEILKIVPGRVSTETDARLSFDVEGSINKGRQLIKLYEEKGIDRQRVLIKIASTWEGIKAAEHLGEGRDQLQPDADVFAAAGGALRGSGRGTDLAVRRPDLRLVQSREQARLHRRGRSGRAVGAGNLHLLQEVRLQDGSDGRELPQYGQIIELAGCDLLTISPELMKELSESYEPVERKLDPEKAKKADVQRLELDEKKFRYLFNDNAMATEKTSEGIRKFAADIVKLEKFVASKIK